LLFFVFDVENGLGSVQNLNVVGYAPENWYSGFFLVTLLILNSELLGKIASVLPVPEYSTLNALTISLKKVSSVYSPSI